jgi:hypothetical protein
MNALAGVCLSRVLCSLIAEATRSYVARNITVLMLPDSREQQILDGLKIRLIRKDEQGYYEAFTIFLKAMPVHIRSEKGVTYVISWVSSFRSIGYIFLLRVKVALLKGGFASISCKRNLFFARRI